MRGGDSGECPPVGDYPFPTLNGRLRQSGDAPIRMNLGRCDPMSVEINLVGVGYAGCHVSVWLK